MKLRGLRRDSNHRCSTASLRYDRLFNNGPARADDRSRNSHGSFKHILTESANGVKTITMNRPDKRNALCPLLIEELTLALREAETCGCGVVILTGAGAAFCAGLDMKHPGDHERQHARGASPRL